MQQPVGSYSTRAEPNVGHFDLHLHGHGGAIDEFGVGGGGSSGAAAAGGDAGYAACGDIDGQGRVGLRLLRLGWHNGMAITDSGSPHRGLKLGRQTYGWAQHKTADDLCLS